MARVAEKAKTMTSSRIGGVAEAIMARAKHYALKLTKGG